jgi:hypothetical protein
MEGLWLAFQWPPTEIIVNYLIVFNFVGRAWGGGKGTGFWVCIIELKNQWM